jgi:hypothetical protein
MLPAADGATDARARIAGFDQEALLHALALLDFNPAELAAQLSISPFALLGWFESDETQSQLARYKAFEHRMLELRAFKTRRLTIEHLEHVLETTEDLIEKRRTAAALLRAIGGTDLRDVKKAGGTDLRDVRKAGGTDLRDATETCVANPNGRTSTNRTAARAKHTSARSTSDAEPGSASDHGTPAPRRPSNSPNAPTSIPPSERRVSDNQDVQSTCDRDSAAPNVMQASSPAPRRKGDHALKSQTDLPAPKPHQLE